MKTDIIKSITMLKQRRNQILVPVVLLIGIAIGGVVILQTKGIGAAILEAGRKITYDPYADENADPDNDGLANWQEKLYRTDLKNPDTDGDGYLDGEEVASGYDATVASPNDALEGTNTAQPRALPKNLTVYLAQILSQKISSGEITPSESAVADFASDPSIPYNEDVINDALAQIGMRAKAYFVLPEIKDSEIKISSEPTTYAQIGIYINQMSQAVTPSAELVQLKKLEIDVIKEAVASKNTKEVGILIDSAQKNLAAIKNITAPKDFADIHKKQIAILLLDEKILQAIEDLGIDPVTAAAGLEIYPDMIEMFHSLSDELNAKIIGYQK